MNIVNVNVPIFDSIAVRSDIFHTVWTFGWWSNMALIICIDNKVIKSTLSVGLWVIYSVLRDSSSRDYYAHSSQNITYTQTLK